MSAGDPSNQAHTTASQEEAKVGDQANGVAPPSPTPTAAPEAGKTATGAVAGAPPTQLKAPRDIFSLSYWLPFLLLVLVGALWIAHKPGAVSLPVLKHDVPAYHVIAANDLAMHQVDRSKVTTDTVLNGQDLIGHYTLVTVQAGQPIRKGQIGPQPEGALITNALAVAIPANNAMILGGNLHAGDIVSMAAVPTSAPTSQPTLIFDKVLVLDVKPAGDQSIIVLAIPADRWLDYLAKTRNVTLVLARRVDG